MKTLLIVNDSEIINKIISKSLEKEGFKTVVASNGKEALGLLDKYLFNLVITDVNMPEMDGIEMTKKIREHENYKFIPVIFLSGSEEPEVLKRAKEAGSSAWLTLPFNVKNVVATINKFLR